MSRNLHFSYRMEIRYSVPVEGGCYTLRTIPESGAVQKVTKLSARMEPGEKVWRSRDPFGNLLQCGRDQGMMERFLFEETGEVTTGLRDSEPAEPYARLVKFRYGGSLVQPGPLLKRFWAGQLEPILAEKNALEQGGGVCQDESHVMIALCRLSGITARYVAGFLYGEGESHAWVEVLHDGHWYGLDPTNAIPAGEKHIRIAVGRDVGDCPMNSGIFYGSADQTIQVKVKVW